MKIKIMSCKWNKALEGQELEVEKITSNTPTRVILFQILKKIEEIEKRLDKIEKRLDKVEARLDRVETRLDRVEARLDNLVKKNNLIE